MTFSALCPIRVGREEEVVALTDVARRRATTMIAGSAGVGKSRLAAEAMRVAGEQGLVVMVGNCSLDQSVPYAPFVSAIRRRTRTMSSEQLAELFSGASRFAAVLLPETAPSDVSLTSLSPDDLFAALWQLLHRLAGESGCLLLIEDLHWADPDSLRLFSYLASEIDDLNVWMVATYRPDELHRTHPLTATLAQLHRERRLEEILLRPLTREEVRAMIGAIFSGAEVGDEFVDAVVERTGGNPFFVEELLKVLLDRGDLYLEGESWERRELDEMELPMTVRESLLTRTRSLTPRRLAVLRLGALAGDRIEIPVLAAASGQGVEEVEDAIRDGLALQLIAERRDGPSVTFSFRHALTREAMAEEIVGPDRQRAHRRLAEAIKAVNVDSLDSVVAELADHYTRAGLSAPAVEFGLRAAEQAATHFALEEAGRLFEAALRQIPEGDPRRLSVSLDAAQALRDSPDTALAASFAQEARSLARERGDRLAEAQALVALGHVAWVEGKSSVALAWHRDAVVAAHGVDEFQEARALGTLIRSLVFNDLVEEAIELLPGAIDLATKAQNWTALASLYGSKTIVVGVGDEFEETFLASVAAAQRGGDGHSEYILTLNGGYICLWNGAFERSRELLSRAVELGRRVAPRDRYARAGYAWLLSLTGDYDEAWSLGTELRHDPLVHTRVVALSALYEVADRRSLECLEEIVDELATTALRTGESQRVVPARAARARYALRTTGSTEAGPLCWEAVLQLVPNSRAGAHWMISPDYARSLAADERLEELVDWRDAVTAQSDADANANNVAASTLVEAYLALTRGELDIARDLFAAAASTFASMPFPAREVEAWLGLADLELRAGLVEASIVAARRAQSIAERIGAGALIARCHAASGRANLATVLLTVMFSDIVDSTTRASILGDRAWSALLERHNGVVRRELENGHGREVKTTGDGFLATFGSPSQAIRTARAMVESLAAIGLDIRIGLHTGECQVVEGDLTGIAVHAAARVCSEAGAGEVLVSSAVHDLVASAGIELADRGEYELKGVPGRWRLYSA